MIPVPVLKWVATLTDEDLRMGYVEALDWLYEAPTVGAESFPLMTTCWQEITTEEPDFDDIAAAILLEIGGRWVYAQDTVTP